MNLRKVLLYLRVIMPVIFLSIGLYCLIYPEKVNIEPQYCKVLGFILIGYAFFRGYRAWKDIKHENSKA